MTQITFIDFMNQTKARATVVQEAARLYVGELTDDLPPEDLQAEVVKATGDQTFVTAALTELEHEHETADAILLTFLADQWEKLGEPEKIQRAFDAAEKKLPVIETLVIASVALYGIYAVAHEHYVAKTGGLKKTIRTVQRRRDGTVEETETKEFTPPATPDGAVKSLFDAIKRSVGR